MQFSSDQHFQDCSGAADCAADGEKCLAIVGMLLRYRLKSLANAVKLLRFAQDGCGRHRHALFANLGGEDSRWTALAQKT